MSIAPWQRTSTARFPIYSLRVQGPTKLRELLESCRIGPGRWRANIYPTPSGLQPSGADWADVSVLPLSTITIAPAAKDEKAIVIDD